MNKTVATIFSIIGHPIFVLTYVLLLMMASDPYAFKSGQLSDTNAVLFLFSIFSSTVIIPGIGVLLMKPLGLVKTWDLKDKQDRIGPYIVMGIFYIWLFKNLYSLGQAPHLFMEFVLGATIGLFLAFFINIFTKISVHAVGMGGLIAMCIILIFEWSRSILPLQFSQSLWTVDFQLILLLSIILAGLVGMSRLALHAHTPADLYRGYVAGFAAVFIATSIL